MPTVVRNGSEEITCEGRSVSPPATASVTRPSAHDQLGHPVRSAVAAAFGALVFHTMLYADFLEDPTTWVLLGIGLALAADRDRAYANAQMRLADDTSLRRPVGQRCERRFVGRQRQHRAVTVKQQEAVAAAQEGAVVRDRDDRAGEPVEGRLQRLAGVGVEIVGRFVEQQ